MKQWFTLILVLIIGALTVQMLYFEHTVTYNWMASAGLLLCVSIMIFIWRRKKL